MSIATAITNAQNKVAAAYTSVNTMGGTLPTTQNLSNLPAAIESIPNSEILFTSTIEDVGSADYEYDIPNKTFTIKLPEIVQGLSASALSYAFDGWKSNLVIDFPHISYMRNNAMEYAFRNSGLSSISMPNLVNLPGSRAMLYAFQNCTALTEFNLQKFASANGAYACRQMLNGCSGLVSVTFISLEEISGNQAFSYTFANCSSGITIYFPKLIIFGSYTNQFNMMLSGVNNATVHFRSDIKNTIKNWSDVLSGFGGTNTTILFDL